MKWYHLLSIVLISASCVTAEELRVQSPGNILDLAFRLDRGVPQYDVSRFGEPVLLPGRLGLLLLDEAPLAWDFTVVSHQVRVVDENWTTVWGERELVRNNYTELRVELQEEHGDHRRLNYIFRVFDDGVGFRYEIPEQPAMDCINIMDELTEFALAGDHRSWWIKAYQWNRYEYLPACSPVSEIDTVHTPLTMETADGLYLSIHEAALTDFASMTLKRTGQTTLEADLVPWSDGVRVKGQTPLVSPWRTIVICDTPGNLITSDLVLNLNEPCKIEDTSWIKPAKYVGIWWEMHIDVSTWGSGEKHGATTAKAKHYIDFAAKYGFDGVLVEGWNTGWDGDWIANGDIFNFTEAHPEFDMEAVSRYAKEKGVSLIGHHETGGSPINYERQLEDAFAYYKRFGVNTIKTGYVNHGQNIKRIDDDGNLALEWHHGQHMVRHYRKVVEAAAAQHIMLDVHEPIKDTGIRRTWPNMMTREGARGQEFNAWGENGGNPPDYTTLIPFTRLLSGPMDFTPGIFDILLPTKPENRVNTTLAKQLALYVVLYSPLQMAADLPENYERHLDAFQFIRDVPVDWSETRVLNARINDYLTIVRRERGGDDWFLGSITDEFGRVLEIPLNFLDAGRPYVAQVYRDGDTADWKSDPLNYVVEERLVECGDTLPLRLAPGGGVAIRFRPAARKDLRRLTH